MPRRKRHAPRNKAKLSKNTGQGPGVPRGRKQERRNEPNWDVTPNESMALRPSLDSLPNGHPLRSKAKLSKNTGQGRGGAKGPKARMTKQSQLERNSQRINGAGTLSGQPPERPPPVTRVARGESDLRLSD
jgi:hypothetical protein